MPAPQACCAEAVIPSRTCPQRVEAEEVDDAADVPGQRSEAIRLPERDTVVRKRVLAASARQRTRGSLNARLANAALREHCALDSAARRLAADAVDRGGTSARGVHRALRVARTIADLAGATHVSDIALAEALQYRSYEARRFAAPRSAAAA